MDKWLMLEQIAGYLQLSTFSNYRMAQTVMFPSYKVDRQWWFKKEVVDKLLSEDSIERVTENIKSSSQKIGR